MIRVDPQYIGDIRSVQEMFFHTKAGNLLLAGIIEEGHINGKIETDEERVEHNFARRILQSAGIELTPKPAELVPLESAEQNVIDSTLGLQGDEDNE